MADAPSAPRIAAAGDVGSRSGSAPPGRSGRACRSDAPLRDAHARRRRVVRPSRRGSQRRVDGGPRAGGGRGRRSTRRPAPLPTMGAADLRPARRRRWARRSGPRSPAARGALPRCGRPSRRAAHGAPRQRRPRTCAAAEAELAAAGGARRRARTSAAAAAERHSALQATVGAAVAELQARLTRRDRRAAQRTAARRMPLSRSGRRPTRTRAPQRADRGAHSGARAARPKVVGKQRLTCGASRRSGSLAVAAPDLVVPTDDEWGVTPALRLARQIEQELADVDDEQAVLDRAQRRVTDESRRLADALRRHGNSAPAQLQEEGIDVEVVFRGRRTTVPASSHALVEEVADRQSAARRARARDPGEPSGQRGREHAAGAHRRRRSAGRWR